MLDKKAIVFNDECAFALGDICYVKFIGENNEYAMFYKPLIAPKYFKDYLKENDIHIAYEIKDFDNLELVKDYVFTFTNKEGLWKVEKGLNPEEKYLLFVDSGMEIELTLPKYFYEFKDDKIITKPYRKGIDKSYCYVGDNTVNENLKSIMIPVIENLPGTYEFKEYKKDKIKVKK